MKAIGCALPKKARPSSSKLFGFQVRHFFFISLLFTFYFFPLRSHALESDQYWYWQALPIRDSTVQVNRHINSLLQKFLDKKINVLKNSYAEQPLAQPRGKYSRERHVLQNLREPLPCATVASEFLQYIRPHFFQNKFKQAVFNDAEVQLHPQKKRFFHDYRQSIYGGLVWPFMMPVSQTIKINRVYLGTDKIDHFFSSGKRYYKVYRRYLKAGLNQEEATKKAIRFGLSLMEEKGVLGLWSSGAFSYADLESNYQGMMLGIAMCEGKKPHLRLSSDGQWRVQYPIDFQKHVNPLWDEAYNNSYYAKYRHKNLFRRVAEYCALGKTPKVKKIWRDYDQRLRPSTNTRYLQALIEEGAIPNPMPQSFAHVCGYPKGLMQGLPLGQLKSK